LVLTPVLPLVVFPSLPSARVVVLVFVVVVLHEYGVFLFCA